MSDEPADLSLVSTDDLIEELKRRYDSTLICFEREADAESTVTAVDYGGPISAAVGMAAVAQAQLVRQALRDADGDDGSSADAL